MLLKNWLHFFKFNKTWIWSWVATSHSVSRVRGRYSVGLRILQQPRYALAWTGPWRESNFPSPGLNKSLFFLPELPQLILPCSTWLTVDNCSLPINRRKMCSEFLHPGTHPATIQRLFGSVSLGVQQPRPETDHSPPFRVEIKNERCSSSMAVSRTASLFVSVHRTKPKEI
jgi:hypothetical protein